MFVLSAGIKRWLSLLIYIKIYILDKVGAKSWTMEEKRGITETKMWRFSSDIKRGQAIWKRSRDEVKPADD